MTKNTIHYRVSKPLSKSEIRLFGIISTLNKSAVNWQLVTNLLKMFTLVQKVKISWKKRRKVRVGNTLNCIAELITWSRGEPNIAKSLINYHKHKLTSNKDYESPEVITSLLEDMTGVGCECRVEAERF